MKRKWLLFGVLAAAVLAGLFYHREKFAPIYETWIEWRAEELRTHYPGKLAGAIRNADETHLFRLGDFGAQGSQDRQFPIVPHDTEAKILESKILAADAHQKLREAFAAAIAMPEGSSAMCHDPAYGLRFVKDGKVIFETSLCWECSNYYIKFPDPFGSSWMGMSDGFEEVRKLVMAEMPLPAATATSN